MSPAHEPKVKLAVIALVVIAASRMNRRSFTFGATGEKMNFNGIEPKFERLFDSLQTN